MGEFMMGAMAMASLVIGLFFFKYWQRTKDRLFFIFSCAFWILGITRVGLVITDGDELHENEFWYVVRLIAFLLILYAIWDKNRPPRKSRAAEKQGE